ncbi:hypothetical protein ACFX16_009809 [Malus domestica]
MGEESNGLAPPCNRINHDNLESEPWIFGYPSLLNNVSRYERLEDFCYRCGRIGHANNECNFEANSGGAPGYGEWTKAPLVREFVKPVKPLTLGWEKGEGRGWSQGYKVEVTSSGRDKKKWRRLQRLQVSSNPFQWVVPQGWEYPMWELGARDLNVEVSHHSGVDDLGRLSRMGVNRQWMPPSLLLNEASNLKRGMDPQNMEMTQSPQKKVRGTESDEPTKGKMVENLRRLSMKDSCGMVERTNFMEDELHAVLLELCEKWDYVKENVEAEKWEILATTSGKLVQDGGGWPSTAARSP